jgi:hypothetical protein
MFSQASASGFVSDVGGREAYSTGYVQVGLQTMSSSKLRGTEYELYQGRTRFKSQTVYLF